MPTSSATKSLQLFCEEKSAIVWLIWAVLKIHILLHAAEVDVTDTGCQVNIQNINNEICIWSLVFIIINERK